MRRTYVAWALGLVISACAWAADDGLVAHWDFDQGRGDVLHDRSSNENHGKIHGAEWAKSGKGYALRFDGLDDYVDCGTGESLNIASGGTVMVWCRPTTVQGGLVAWNIGSNWQDLRMVMTINTYRGDKETVGCLADSTVYRSPGYGYQVFRGFGVLARDEWTHLAYTVNGKTISIYRDGLLTNTVSQLIGPETKGVPLLIGRCEGLGKAYFHGLLDEVRIYNRALSSGQILARYKEDAAARGKDLSVLHRIGLEVQAYPDPGQIMATLDAQPMRPLPEGARLRARLFKTAARKPEQIIEVSDIPEAGTSDVLFDATKLPAGSYDIRASAVGPDGTCIGEETSVSVNWTGRTDAFKNVKMLNNLCWELLDVHGDGAIGRSQSFTLPMDRWIFIRTRADVTAGGEIRLCLDADPKDKAAVVHSASGTLEAMRYLKAGRHMLHIHRGGQAGISHLVVRAIPALQHAFYNANPLIPFGPYDWQFLEKHVCPNVNVMISGGLPKSQHVSAWKAMGRSWIAITWIASIPKGLQYAPKDKMDAENAVEEVYKYLASYSGFKNPLMDGMILDEIGGDDIPIFDVYRKAVERIYAQPEFRDKGFMVYLNRPVVQAGSGREFLRACLDGGGYICWEQYLMEQPTEHVARRFVHHRMVAPMVDWKKALPGCTSRMVIVLGYLCQPPESLSVNPTVDFKVCMDMYVRSLATHPVFFGLGGIQWYHSGYCDEESLRWAARLYRHYGIEGNTHPLTKDPYNLTHVENPDFADGTTGWQIQPAEPGSIRTEKQAGYSWLVGRYERTIMGDTFLWMKRSANRPNTFSQEIRNLTHGRLYSMKMITADYQDLVQGKSDKKLHAVSVTLDNVEILTGPKKSFQFPFPNGHSFGKFGREHKLWMNYHWRVFRAKAAKADLTVTDWKTPTQPGGPIGQELVLNFIEIQPYLEEE